VSSSASRPKRPAAGVRSAQTLGLMNTVADIENFLKADGRASGHVHLYHSAMPEAAVGNEPSALANAVVRSFGYAAINPRSWSVLDRTSAVSVVRRLLSEDLAYKSELIPERTAAYAAEQLVGALSKYHARFLCNAEFQGTSMSWDAIGTSTFEVAVVGFDEAQVFLLYAEAED